MAMVLAPIQIFVGDLHGLNTLEHQPAKIAAMEALWETEEGAPLVLFALPDAESRTNRFAVEIPHGASLILTHEFNGRIRGINEFPDAHPPVALLFWSFRIMVGIGVLMLAVSWVAAWTLLRGREPARWLARGLALMTFAGWIGVLSGWYTTEVGRQPFLVHGVLRTAEAVTAVPASDVGLTLALYLTLYVVLITAYVSVVFYLARRAGDAEAKSSAPTALGPSVLTRSRLEPGHA